METYHLRKTIHRIPGKVIHAIPLPEPEVTEGHGARGQIGEICRTSGYKQVLLVTDRVLSKLGYTQAIEDSLQAAGIGFTTYADIHSEPTIAYIEAGRKQALDTGAEAIIALGGGSVMDTTKMIAAGVKMPHIPAKMLLLKFLPVPGGSLPIINVPSTAGTGAEMTVGAVVMNEQGVKGSTVLIGLNVTHVVLDSELTVHAPQQVTAACAVDALSHCIEGIISDTQSDEEDMNLSLEGVRLILQHLPVVMQDPENTEARLGMCRAAMYGGNAINTQLAGYVHAFAHSIGGMYHIPHGKAIAHCLLPVLEAQKDICLDRLAALAVYCGRAEETESEEAAAENLLATLRKLLTDCGLEKGCAAIREEDTEELLRLVNADSINYSPPKTFSDRELTEILDHIRRGE